MQMHACHMHEHCLHGDRGCVCSHLDFWRSKTAQEGPLGTQCVVSSAMLLGVTFSF